MGGVNEPVKTGDSFKIGVTHESGEKKGQTEIVTDQDAGRESTEQRPEDRND